MKYYITQFETILMKVDSDNNLFVYDHDGWQRQTPPDSWEQFYENYREISKQDLVKRVLKS